MTTTTIIIHWALFIVLTVNGEVARVDKSVVVPDLATCESAAATARAVQPPNERARVTVVCVPEFIEVASSPGGAK